MMAKNKSNKKNVSERKTSAASPSQGGQRWLAPIAIVVMLTAAAVIFYYGSIGRRKSATSTAGAAAQPANTPVAGVNTPNMGINGEPVKMNIAQAVMVTVEL